MPGKEKKRESALTDPPKKLQKIFYNFDVRNGSNSDNFQELFDTITTYISIDKLTGLMGEVLNFENATRGDILIKISRLDWKPTGFAIIVEKTINDVWINDGTINLNKINNSETEKWSYRKLKNQQYFFRVLSDNIEKTERGIAK